VTRRHPNRPPRRPRRVQRAIRRHGLMWGASRALGAVLVGIVVLAGIGTGYQHLATLRDAHRHPPPGRMVAVDARTLHLDCTGEGDPTVVLDGGLGEWSVHWAKVQALVARETRVCSYDRSGYGWSPAARVPRTAEQRAEDLHTVLKNGEIAPPYVLVGHGAAGLHLIGYTSGHPDWVAGLVLVDAVPPDMVELYDRRLAPVLKRLRRATAAAEFGLLRFTGPPKLLGPRPAGGDYRRQGAHPGFLEAYVAEAANLASDADWAEASPLPPTLPLVVLADESPMGAAPALDEASDEDVHYEEEPLSADRYNRLWRRHERELADLTRDATVQLVPGSLDLPLEAPGVVAKAILGVVHRVRGGGP
jgi:pimeloyl-ACP methyl ester carboxylesterase